MAHGKISHVLKADVGLIGGTGVADRLAHLGGRTVHVPTRFGLLKGLLTEQGGRQVVIVRRHSKGHSVPPHKVDFRRIAEGLRCLGVRACFSSAAVGSLRDDWPVGTLASCTDFLDWSSRSQTLFDKQARHTDFSKPFPASKLLSGKDVLTECVYACMNGPRYETPHEVTTLRSLGADVVGMTAATEAVVMREANIQYGCLAVVTNMGCGIAAEPLSHGEVTDVMTQRGDRIVEVMLAAVAKS